MNFIYGLLSGAAGAAAVVVAQGLGKYNLTTDVLWLIGLGQKYEAAVLAKLTTKAKKVASDL